MSYLCFNIDFPVLLLVFLIYVKQGSPLEYFNISKQRCGQVYLTVSSLSDTNLEMNWITDCDPDKGDVVPDYIVLVTKDVNDRDEELTPLVKVWTAEYPGGYYRTKVSFGYPWLPGGWEYDPGRDGVFIEGTGRWAPPPDPGIQCFPYWIASMTVQGQVVSSRCLAIRPTWMNDLRSRIGNIKLGNLFIPGTHNSATYAPHMPAFVRDYVQDQDRAVWTQLVFGIRYLDLRIGYYVNEGFYINHDVVQVSPAQEVFKQIRQFSKLAPGEVIVVDFHRFPYPSNFNQSLHRRFLQLVENELGHLALSPAGLQVGRGPTLNEVWAANKSLILCYADRDAAKAKPWLWQPLKQYWADTKDLGMLKRFLRESISDHRPAGNPLYALMAEFTPTKLDLIFRTNDLRNLAQKVNGYLTTWFRDEFTSDVNIVATDYFLGNDLVNVAIEANSKLGR